MAAAVAQNSPDAAVAGEVEVEAEAAFEMIHEDEDIFECPLFLDSMRYVCNVFLEERHYSQMHKSLSAKWDREHSMSAAIRLMQQYGVKLTEKEQEDLAKLDEGEQIGKLVSLMPQQSNAEFQNFFLQLQLIVSTAQRIKSCLEDGNTQRVREALEDAENTGIAPYILKMAITQAGTEVTSLRSKFTSFVRETDQSLGKLTRGQEEAMQAQRRLAAAQAQLSSAQGESAQKAKKFMMGIAGDNPKVILASSFTGWKLFVKQWKEEKEIREEYEYRIEAAEQRLIDVKSKQLESIRGVMMKKGDAMMMALLAEIWKVFTNLLDEAKWEKENADKLAYFDQKMKDMQRGQADGARAVLNRMSADGDQALLDMCFKAMVKNHEEYLKDKETNDAVKAAEARVRAFQSSHKEKGKGILSKMEESTTTGLLSSVMSTWCQDFVETKQERELEAILNDTEGKFASFGEGNKKSAHSVMERARQHQEEMVFRRHFNAWRIDSRTSKLSSEFQAKIDGKKQQLHSVQTLFRQFAAQLEQGMKEQVSARELYKKRTKTMTQGGGSTSLPDIHG